MDRTNGNTQQQPLMKKCSKLLKTQDGLHFKPILLLDDLAKQFRKNVLIMVLLIFFIAGSKVQR
jgi:hypothetical protein